MKTVNQIKQEMELVEIVKSALDVNGQVARKLIKEWTQTELCEDKVKIIGGTISAPTAKLHTGEKVLNKEELIKMNENASRNSKVIGDALSGVLISCIEVAKQENEKDIHSGNLEAVEFDITLIPLKLLSKVSNDTHNKQIERVLSTIKAIEPNGFSMISKEGGELSRIEKILESRITRSLDDGNYQSLENSVHLLNKVKDTYETIFTLGHWNAK